MNDQIQSLPFIGEGNKNESKFERVFFRQQSGPAVFLGFKIDTVEENKLTVMFSDGNKKTYSGNSGQFATDDGYGIFLDPAF